MTEDLKTFKTAFAEWEGLECRIVTIEFRIEDERDALVIAEIWLCWKGMSCSICQRVEAIDRVLRSRRQFEKRSYSRKRLG
jgi:hypothetical protein